MRWDEEAIRAALTELLEGWDRWPTCREFAANGAKGLREALTRVHGAQWWAAEMGLPEGDRRPGGVRRWSDQAIIDALTTLIGSSGRWPTSREFDEAGLHRLREALRHYGGPQRWSGELGVPWEPPPQAKRARRLAADRTGAASPSASTWPKWTDQTIDAELRRFVDGRTDWPRHREFVQSGRKGLYHAILKHGGTRVWAERVGVEFGPERRRGRPWSEQRVAIELAQFLAGRDRWPSGREFTAAGRGPLLRAVRRFGGSERWRHEFRLDQAATDADVRLVPNPASGRHRYWTDQRIAETIAPLIKQLGRWPTKSEFRRAGMLSALAAVYDHGGSARWRARFGVVALPARGPVPSRRK